MRVVTKMSAVIFLYRQPGVAGQLVFQPEETECFHHALETFITFDMVKHEWMQVLKVPSFTTTFLDHPSIHDIIVTTF